MFNQFIHGKTGGYCDPLSRTKWYQSDTLLCRNSSVSSFSIVMKPYCVIWYDFVSFRINLFETQLKLLLYKELNCSIKDIQKFYSYFKHYRNHFAILPTQITNRYIPPDSRLDLYQEIVNYFSNSIWSIGIQKIKNINPILVYYYIWNCIYCIMHKFNPTQAQWDPKYGFDYKIGFKSNILIKHNNIFVIDSNKICKLLKEYIIDQLTQTNVFGNYFVTRRETEKTEKEKIESINKCEEYLFSNDFVEFNELLEYSISDLVNTSGNITDYKKLFSEDNDCDSGFSNIIGNRLCYAIFYDLSMYSLNLPDEMKFPKLIKFYKFIFNFSIYLHCYPFKKYDDSDISMHQEYYLVQYFKYKDNIFQNIAQLKQFNYLDIGNYDGTLLHGATCAGFRQMCQVLIKDGFDCKKLNRRKTTPYNLGQKRNDLFILALFDDQVEL